MSRRLPSAQSPFKDSREVGSLSRLRQSEVVRCLKALCLAMPPLGQKVQGTLCLTQNREVWSISELFFLA